MENQSYSIPITPTTDESVSMGTGISRPSGIVADEGLANLVDVPVSQYENINDKSYIVDLLQMEEFEGLDDISDIDLIRDKVQIIDNYVMELIQERGLNDTRDSYAQVIDELSIQNLIEPNESPHQKVDKLTRYILRADRRDPVRGKASQLKKLLYGRNT